MDSKPISSYEIPNSSSGLAMRRKRKKFNKTRVAREINSVQTQSTFNSSLLRLEHTNTEEKEMIINVTTEFQDVFYIEGQPLPTSTAFSHEIKTTDNTPVHTKTYRYPYVHREEVHKQITKMLNDGVIRPSYSPWSSPIWIVPKKVDASGQKKWRIVIDYRKLNEKTIGDRYPLPNISDLLDKLGKCKYYTTLDLASGFHQLPMHPNSIQKTAFNVENGHYEFLKMPFGLKNAPSPFQRAMDIVQAGSKFLRRVVSRYPPYTAKTFYLKWFSATRGAHLSTVAPGK